MTSLEAEIKDIKAMLSRIHTYPDVLTTQQAMQMMQVKNHETFNKLLREKKIAPISKTPLRYLRNHLIGERV